MLEAIEKEESPIDRILNSVGDKVEVPIIEANQGWLEWLVKASPEKREQLLAIRFKLSPSCPQSAE